MLRRRFRVSGARATLRAARRQIDTDLLFAAFQFSVSGRRPPQPPPPAARRPPPAAAAMSGAPSSAAFSVACRSVAPFGRSAVGRGGGGAPLPPSASSSSSAAAPVSFAASSGVAAKEAFRTLLARRGTKKWVKVAADLAPVNRSNRNPNQIKASCPCWRSRCWGLTPNKHRLGIEWAHHHIIAAVIAPP